MAACGAPLGRVGRGTQVAVSRRNGAHAGSQAGHDVAVVVSDINAAFRIDTKAANCFEQGFWMRLGVRCA